MTNLISQKNFDSTTIKRQVNTVSGITTDFTITGGYNPGFIDVFLNGVKQRSGTDFTATSGTIVTMVPYTNVGDVLEFQIYENMDVAGVSSVTNATNAYNIVGGVSFATSAGISTALNSDSSINTSGIITASQLAISGLSTSKDLLVTGITSATNIIEIKSNDSTPGRIDLYCETNNAHYARLQAPEHGDFGGNITVKLPSSTGTLLLSDGSGASLTSLNASNLGSGTIPDARFPASLPAISGQNLTGIVTGITAGSNITVFENTSGNFIITSTGGGGGDTVSINASAGDILSASSGEISADDAGSDKLVFWDDSESKLTYLTAGSGLSISGTTITASGSGGGSGISSVGIQSGGVLVGTAKTINFAGGVTVTNDVATVSIGSTTRFVGARMYHDDYSVTASSSWTEVTNFDGTSIDTNSFANTTNGRFTIPAGVSKIKLSMSVRVVANGNTSNQWAIRKNGGGNISTIDGGFVIDIDGTSGYNNPGTFGQTGILDVVEGDYFTIRYYVSNTNLDVDAWYQIEVVEGDILGTYFSANNIVDDTTPQLGGNFDINGNDITGTGNFNITGVITSSSFSGSGAGLTSIPAGELSGALPAISGASLTNLTGASAATYGDGSNVAAITVDANGRITNISEVSISGGGGGSSGIEIENNGTSVGTGITAINFSTNVTATASGGIATVTASGGGGGGSDGPSSVMMGMIF